MQAGEHFDDHGLVSFVELFEDLELAPEPAVFGGVKQIGTVRCRCWRRGWFVAIHEGFHGDTEDFGQLGDDRRGRIAAFLFIVEHGPHGAVDAGC